MSREQLQQDGLAGPFELADKSQLDEACEIALELKALRRQQNLVAEKTGTANVTPNTMLDRHMDVRVIRDRFFDANLQAQVSDHFGNDLFLWRSNFFIKKEGTGENIWHHDRQFENGSAPINLFDTSNHFSILMALTDISLDAGVVEYVKGSHLPIEGFDRDRMPRHVTELPNAVHNNITPLPLEKGQFVLFHSSLMHRSLAFGGGNTRISMIGRLARIGTDMPPDNWYQRAYENQGQTAVPAIGSSNPQVRPQPGILTFN